MPKSISTWLARIYLVALHLLVGLVLWKSDFLYKANAKLGLSGQLETSFEDRSKRQANDYFDRVDGLLNRAPIVLLGDSTMASLAPNAVWTGSVNLGLGGTTTLDLIRAIGRLPSLDKAALVVLAVGINDLCLDQASRSEFARRLRLLAPRLPATRPTYWTSILPTDPRAKHARCSVAADSIRNANLAISAACSSMPRCTYVDIHPAFADAQGYLKQDLHDGDGIHLNRRGYALFTQQLMHKIKP